MLILVKTDMFILNIKYKHITEISWKPCVWYKKISVVTSPVETSVCHIRNLG